MNDERAELFPGLPSLRASPDGVTGVGPATNGYMDTRRHFTGSPWEPVVGYCRALRAGDHVFVSGTAPVAEGGGVFAPGDPYRQMQRCCEIVLAALANLGARPEHVVRTRMFVTDISRWKDIGRAHAEAFGKSPPVTSMVEVKALIDPGMMIELEAEALVR